MRNDNKLFAAAYGSTLGAEANFLRTNKFFSGAYGSVPG
ncbi:Protein of unknown function [Pyronema omphalodes CBS 100304]|uniref:Uncharacterized protein n=1 Tax=Pyronema omphalodes (strain CBS 100304) TaxID=1076935 RepID=U4LLB4_PYROM|nr:Protein of unknown function [Pyronema omphalodes CBS 100304]